MANNAAEQLDLVNLTADIVSAQVAGNKMATGDVAPLIEAVHAALAGLGQPEPETPAPPKRPIGVRASIKANGLVSMIDGKLYQSLKRHLGRHGHTPDSYRQLFGLPVDYPMVSAAYAEKRRALAKAIGLGRKPAAAKTGGQKKGGVRRTLKVAIDAAKGHLGGS